MLHTSFLEKLIRSPSENDKIVLLENHEEVFQTLKKFPELAHHLKILKKAKEKYLFLALIYINQYHSLRLLDHKALNTLLCSLMPIESFYASIGGIVGYHLKLISLLLEQKEKHQNPELSIYPPPMIDIRTQTPDINHYINITIDSLDKLCEIYPIGGVGDRLGLIDPKSKKPLPVANLPFMGKTLLQGLIDDLVARENLFEKKHKKKLITPLVIMTGQDNDNDQQIKQMFEKHHYFGRPKDSILFIQQPSAPMISETGQWIIDKSGVLETKPSGHGALWKTMLDQQAFEWLAKQKKKYALIRQINNPIVAIDFGLLAFLGYGIAEKKLFGFAACPRKIGSAEGMDVLKETKSSTVYEYSISNIEYTDFKKFAIKDVHAPNSLYSLYPSNTNILFVDLEAIKQKAEVFPFYGFVINMKSTKTITTASNEKIKVKTGRLECMMQNISDAFFISQNKQTTDLTAEELPIYVTYNDRHKTISVTKRAYHKGEDPKETPEEAYYTVQKNHYELLKNFCNFILPDFVPLEQFLLQGPPLTTYLYPGIGPMYVDIARKIHTGRLAHKSELHIDIKNISIKHLDLDGSVCILSKDSKKNGDCHLEEVTVVNQGIDYNKTASFWNGQIQRKESLVIELKKNARFSAKQVTFYGSHHFVVEENTHFRVVQQDHKLAFIKEKIS